MCYYPYREAVMAYAGSVLRQDYFCYTPEVFLSRECEEVVHVVDLKMIKGKHYVSTIVTRS